MKNIILLFIIVFLASCGAVQKIRYYNPTSTEENVETREWANGTAAVKDDICIWVGDDTGLFLPLIAGPVGIPFFPLGILAGKIERPKILDLAVWIIPAKKELNSFTFSPQETILEFENGQQSQPIAIQFSRFKTEWEEKENLWGKRCTVEILSDADHWPTKPPTEFNEPVETWNWARYILRFEKPGENTSPSEIKIKGIRTKAGEEKTFVLKFSEVNKIKYLVSGQDSRGAWMLQTPGTPCGKLLNVKKQ